MERRRSVPEIALAALLALSIAVTAAALAVYFHAVIVKDAGWIYLYGFSSFLYSPSVVTLGIVRLCAEDLLLLGGMIGIGFALLARRPVRLVWPALACAALALVEVDRFLLAFPEQPRTTNWFNFGLTHGFLLDSLQAGIGILVACLLFALLSERLPVRWTAALIPILAVSAALQVWMIFQDDRSMGILSLMSITWASRRFTIVGAALLLSLGLLLYDLALLLFALRALKLGSFHAPEEVLTAPSE